jgi:nucleoside-diphosphate kinase
VKNRTFVMCKPDAVARGLVGEIVARLERKGLTLVAADLRTVDREFAERHYDEHRDKPFFGELVDYMTSGPVMLTCLERESAVLKLREVVGATDPAQAAEGTVRKQFGRSKQMNSVHASDSPASAERELKLFFGAAVVAG